MVDGLLGSFGVDVGIEVMVYYWVVVMDGVVVIVGVVFVVNIMCGEVMEDFFEVMFLGYNEVLFILSIVIGFVFVFLFGNELIVFGGFEGLSSKIVEEIVGGVYLYVGFVGENGLVFYLLNIEVSMDLFSGVFFFDDNVFMLSDEEVVMFCNREVYVNIYFDNFGGGEFCG